MMDAARGPVVKLLAMPAATFAAWAARLRTSNELVKRRGP